MLKYFKLVVLLLICFFGTYTSAQFIFDDETKKIYTKDEGNVINSSDITDPFRDGTTSALKGDNNEGVGGIIISDINNSDEAQGSTLHYTSKWINYFLGFLGLLVMILIIKDGIVIITSANNENKTKESFKNVRNYVLAIIGIGASYMIINLIFYFINININT